MNSRQLILILIAFLIACNHLNENTSEKHKVVISKKDTNSSLIDDSVVEKNIPEKNNGNFIILSISKIYDSASSTYRPNDSTLPFKKGIDWHLTRENILDILESSKPISGTELDLSYLVLPFWYQGKFLLNGTQGKYKINAASFVILKFKDSTIYLGSSQKTLSKYFLVPPYEE
jgi:hypothetical protein